MKRVWKQLTALLLLASMVLMMAVSVNAGLFSKNKTTSSAKKDAASDLAAEVEVTEDGEYTSKEEVALYLHTYGHLPDNFITKYEAQDLGWSGGSLEYYAPGKSIGGSKYKNYEGTLPEKNGRKYYECDIDYDGKKRNAKRIVWSSDGLIFYTEDHYSTFEQLY